MMRMKLVVYSLAFLLLVPQLFAGESSPVVRFAVAPKYPSLTLAKRIYGVVTIRVTIDRAGAVKNAEVKQGHPMLQEAAIEATQQWKFEESSATKRVATLKFSFVILPENSGVKSETIFLPPTRIEIRQKPLETEFEEQDGDFTLVEHPVSRI